VISSDIDKEPIGQLIARISKVLGALRPDAVAVHGWSHPSALAVLECGIHAAEPLDPMSAPLEGGKL
jgi:hypothetical protein